MNYEIVLVSACLLGVSCRYDGSHAWCPEVFDELWHSHFIPVCPEQLGGLGTPRPPAVLDGGSGAEVLTGKARVLTDQGEDITPAFLKGAEETLRLARLAKAKKAIFKDRSPSCGCRSIYRREGLGRGAGVTAAHLAKNDIQVFSEEGDLLVFEEEIDKGK
ncbi:MAG: hypothetical protein H6Q42_3439 [Deltaproteobacteria bacterium]|nr:hypothetical protein [Deltaproteobacteria bacterium]